MLSCIAGEREVFGAASRGYEARSMTVVGAYLAWLSARDFTCPLSKVCRCACVCVCVCVISAVP